ncbi:MAG: hypothetical protein GX574_06975 [Lentisphaerae bacterium]|nr:hypothetical protein [Lentisphaerota bacterium]
MAHIHFTGIGGVGMAGLAHIAADLGEKVTGSDAAESVMLSGLRSRGLEVTAHHVDTLPGQPELLVYSSAVPEHNSERRCAARLGIPEMRRGDYLSTLGQRFARTVAVAGSHGKTTTAAMIAHICREAGLEPGYLVGGAVNGWERSAAAGNGRLLITEVDESDGTQAGFQADIAVVLNVDDDHCWSLGGVEKLEACFVEFGRRAALVVTWRTPTTERLFGDHQPVLFVDEALALSEGAPPQPGPHNRVNGAVAVAVAERLGVSRPAALAALRSFPGVSRRMSERHRSADGRLVIVEDYAHHPAELKAAMAALREGYPQRRLLILFQPHRFERVKRYGATFAELLSGADRAWVVAPFAAWRQDQELADPQEIVRQMRPEAAAGYLANDPDAIAAAVMPEMRGREASVLAVIGAGDICKAIPALCQAMP